MGNAALFAAARTGDEDAWPELVRRYDGLIRAVVSQFSMNSADSGDAAQNTWLRLFERADTVREPEKLGAWLATTARRECLATSPGYRDRRTDSRSVLRRFLLSFFFPSYFLACFAITRFLILS